MITAALGPEYNDRLRGLISPFPPQGDVSGARYADCDAGAEVIVYTIENGGHTWPGGPDIPYMGKATHAVDASEVMWKSLQTHPLNRD
jgi:poly(3-hydroxybutyrate) depolymerase